jgi:pimeloyl-ACP methyl ester carboxylesterase
MAIPLESKYFATNGIHLHAVVAGPSEGKPVILLHGFPEFWRGWKKQIQPLASAGYRVLVPDQRGYNLSDKPKGMAAYTLDEAARDPVGLMDALGYERASFVGHDWGGVVAWWLGLLYPERLERLVILNAPHPAVFKRFLLLHPAQLVRSLYAAFFQIPGLPEAICRNNNWELVVNALRGTSRPGTFSDTDLDLYRQAWWKRDAFTNMLNWYRANFWEMPRFPDGDRIHVPVLVIWGAQDTALRRALAPLSADKCDNGRLVVLENATHWLQHEEPGEVNRLMLEFLSH